MDLYRKAIIWNGCTVRTVYTAHHSLAFVNVNDFVVDGKTTSLHTTFICCLLLMNTYATHLNLLWFYLHWLWNLLEVEKRCVTNRFICEYWVQDWDRMSCKQKKTTQEERQKERKRFSPQIHFSPVIRI